MISPADSELLQLATLWEEYAAGVGKLMTISPAGEGVDELLAWTAARQGLMERLDELFRTIEQVSADIVKKTGISLLTPESLIELDPASASRIEEAARISRQGFSELLVSDARMMGKLKDVASSMANSMKNIKEGRRALQAYNPVDISEARFFDQKK